MIKNNRSVPAKPGIYLFKSRGGKVLYIGKAKNLNKRIASYFRNRRDPLISNLLERTSQIDHIITESENDALHLEYNFIHTYHPPFNIRLKDDKSFPFIEITTSAPFPGIFYSRKPDSDNFLVGPIANANAAKRMIDLVIQIFRIRSCSDRVFHKKRACLYFYIDRCNAPCENRISHEDYAVLVDHAKMFLKGRTGAIVKKLRRQMTNFADQLAFEKAQHIKEQIDLIAAVDLESSISKPVRADFDALALHTKGGEGMILRFSVISGRVARRDVLSFQTVSEQIAEMLSRFLISHYDSTNMPKEIIVPYLPAGHEAIEHLFRSVAGYRVNIRIPKRGYKKEILDLVINNLNETIRKNDYELLARHLRQQLHLEQLPRRIEGLDISHLQGTHRVGAVVVFRDGKPEPSQYRNYIIRSEKSGDTDAVTEVLYRRFKSGTDHPDLLVIDGGRPQLNAAKKAKRDLNLSSDLVALAKREERVFLEDGTSIVFATGTPQRFLLQNIRDEVHRRAVQHHRKRREKIPGK